MELQDNEYFVYHYSSKKFYEFDISKCDGFWFTDISPENKDMLDEIGASGSKYCAKCIVEINNPESCSTYDVERFINGNGCDGIINRYDGFIDYAVIDSKKIKILEWIDI
jgi:hypothetical protein